MRFLFSLLMLSLVAVPAFAVTTNPFGNADASGGSLPFASQQDIPPVGEAMPLQASRQKQAIHLHFTLLDKVYLYRPQLALTPLDAAGHSLNFKAPFKLPAGKPHHDDVYGQTEVFFHQLDIAIPDSSLPDKATSLKVQYQGCLQDVLCYPPQTKTFQLAALTATPTKVASLADTPNPRPAGSPSSNSKQASSDGFFSVLHTASASHFADWAAARSLPLVLLLFFIGGILMAFTPCVFPMYPILLGILAGTHKPSPGRGFSVSLAYVLGMAIPYTLAGLLVAWFGAGFNLHAWLQRPAAILFAVIVFVLLSLSMFGLYELQLPTKWRDKLGAGQGGGSIPQAVIVGVISGLIVSPCITPVLAGALLFVAAQGSITTGVLALFVLSIGMGVPLLIIGSGGASLLPRAGHFMEDIKRFFGLVLLLVAVWLLGRLVSPSTLLWLYGIVLFIYTLMQGALDRGRPLRQALALLVLFYSLLLMIGGALGGHSLVKPLKPLTQSTLSSTKTAPIKAESSSNKIMTGQFVTLPSGQLDEALANATRAHIPVLVDFYADWCTACKELDKKTLSDPAVLAAMKDFRLLRVDITKINAANRKLMQQYKILGLPDLVFFDRNGKEIPHARILGFVNSQQWLQHLNKWVFPVI